MLVNFMKNEEIIEEFLDERDMANISGTDRHLSVKNGALKSYDRILAFWKDGVLYVNKSLKGFSVTTSKHYNTLIRMAESKNIEYKLVSEDDVKSLFGE